jgi:hypothetical protein
MGAGLLLRFIRDRFYIGNIIREAHKLLWLRSINDVLVAVVDRWPQKRSLFTLAVWVCLGGGGLFNKQPLDTDHPLTDGMVPIWFGRRITTDNIGILNDVISSIGIALVKLCRRDYQTRLGQLLKAQEKFYQEGLMTRTQSWLPLRVLENFLLVLNPGFWFYADALITSEDELDLVFDKLNEGFTTWADLRELILLDPSINILSIDWASRKSIQQSARAAKEFIKYAQDEFDRLQTLKRLKVSKAVKRPWDIDLNVSPINVKIY